MNLTDIIREIRKTIVENKDMFSNILAFLLFIYEPLKTYLTQDKFEWQSFILFILGAIVSYSIGKYPKSNANKLEIKHDKIESVEKKGFVINSDMKK